MMQRLLCRKSDKFLAQNLTKSRSW